MIKQTLFFSTPVCLSLKNCQIVISWKDCDDKVTRPIPQIRNPTKVSERCGPNRQECDFSSSD